VVKPVTGVFTWYDSYYFDTYPGGQLWLASGGGWIYSPSFGMDFCFETWVIGGGPVANQPPLVAAAKPAVIANEGSAVANSGTYSDPDGDAVTLSASAGTVMKTGTNNGAWSWSEPAADESPTQNVTITATDSQGAATTTSFTVTVAAVPPTVTISGAPTSGPEGTAITLTGKATSVDPADNSAPIALTWTVTKNGNPFAGGGGSSVSFTPNDEGSYVASLQAVDDGGISATAATTITGANVPPTVVISSVSHDTLVLVAMQPVTVNAAFSDPSTLDTHTSTLDYGDGTPAASASYGPGVYTVLTYSHAYAAAGTYTVTYTVNDDDGGVGVATAKVTVETLAQALTSIADYARTMSSLNDGQKNSLLVKYRTAADSAASGDTKTACNQLGAALNELSALTKRGRLSTSDSDALMSSTWNVHRALGCSKIKLAWLTFQL
jgi:hypothetical protein